MRLTCSPESYAKSARSCNACIAPNLTLPFAKFHKQLHVASVYAVFPQDVCQKRKLYNPATKEERFMRTFIYLFIYFLYDTKDFAFFSIAGSLKEKFDNHLRGWTITEDFFTFSIVSESRTYLLFLDLELFEKTLFTQTETLRIKYYVSF